MESQSDKSVRVCRHCGRSALRGCLPCRNAGLNQDIVRLPAGFRGWSKMSPEEILSYLQSDAFRQIELERKLGREEMLRRQKAARIGTKS